MLSEAEDIRSLEGTAHRIREDLMEMFHSSAKGHIGGSLSIVELLVALYFRIMRVDPKNPRWPDRDRLVLSKGHGAATLYAVLAEKGFFSKELLFSQFIKLDGILQEHAEMRKIPGVEMSTGPLGQGLSVGLGMSLAARVTGRSYKVYVIMSDAEMQSGQTWEAFLACSHHHASGLTAMLDYNKLQVTQSVDRITGIEPLREKFQAFGWNVLEVDGHDLAQVVKALETARDNSTSSPTMIICHTIKGKGISFMERSVEWHSHVFSEQDYLRARHELEQHRMNF